MVIAVGALLGAWMNRHVLRRVNAISAAGREIVEGSLGRRLPRSGSGDEFDSPAANLNEMLDRVERLTAALRLVIDSTAHDLRGPLNGMRARIEAGLRGTDADGGRRGVRRGAHASRQPGARGHPARPESGAPLPVTAAGAHGNRPSSTAPATRA